MNLLMIAGGLVLLYFGAEWLVSGASRLALSLRISQLTVGLTVVAYGTSAPEMVVGVASSRTGHGDVALGNVVGSNIANLGLILAVVVLVRPASVAKVLAEREVPVLAVTTVALPLMLADGRLGLRECVGLLFVALGYTVWMVRATRSARSGVIDAREELETEAEIAEEAGAPTGVSRGRLAFIALAGLGVLLLGGQLFVTGAVALARALGMSEKLVGLTIVAVGTSLPELATGLLAARKGHSDIAVGNVVGSNIFNVLLCLPAAALAGPIRSPVGVLTPDMAALIAVSALGVVLLRKERTIQRREGALLLASYAAFMAYTIAKA
jgi:cation:H+ antiporter